MQVTLIACTPDSKLTVPAATRFSTSTITTKPGLISRYHEIHMRLAKMRHTMRIKTRDYSATLFCSPIRRRHNFGG